MPKLDLPPVGDDAVRYHDDRASSWDDLYRTGGFRRRARTAFECLEGVPVAGRWLDAGCGSGFFSRALVTRGASQVVGLDASASMIASARARAAQDHVLGVTFERVATIETLPLADASFDGAICFSVIEYLARPEDAVSELARVLKPGGILFASVADRRSLVRRAQRLLRAVARPFARDPFSYLRHSRNEYDRADVERLLSSAGLHVRRTREFDPVLPPSATGLFRGSLLFVMAEKER